MKIMAFVPITPWQIEGGKSGRSDRYHLWGSRITADSDCSHDIERHLHLGRKDVTNLCVKKQRHHLLTKVRRVKAVVLPVVMYGCESWTIKRTECQKIDGF